MLIKSPPHCLYMMLSARVENCGPSMQTMHLSVNNWTPAPWAWRAFRNLTSNQCTSFMLKGSPKAACATTVRPSKKLAGRIPLVRSIICVGRMKEPGVISSRKEPTAEKAMMARTPMDLRAATLAREGTAEGAMVCPWPCRVRKAMRTPEGREDIVIGELGKPQGYFFSSRMQSCIIGRDLTVE